MLGVLEMGRKYVLGFLRCSTRSPGHCSVPNLIHSIL